MKDMDQKLKTAMSNKARCLPHCERWQYSTSTSFVDLENDEPRGKQIYSRINIYYGGFGYRHYTEVREIPVYLAFCNFGNVTGLYLGMSIVSFFHFGFYSIRYCWLVRKFRKETKKARIKKSKVAPAVSTTGL